MQTILDAGRNLGRWICRLSFCVAAFEETGDRRGARRFDKNSFVAREPSLRFENFFVSHDVDRALRFLHRALAPLPACRISDANGGCNRLRFRDNFVVKNRRRPRCLESNHARVTASIFRARGNSRYPAQ